MIEFKVEPWRRIREDIAPLWQRHYDEIGQDKDCIPLDPNWEGYDRLAEAGWLRIVAGRRDGLLVAYVFAFVSPHLHYKSTIFADFDLYYVAPEARGGRTAFRMLQAMEDELRASGVTKVVANTKLAHDAGRLFDHLGYREAERIYVKVI